MARRMDIEKKLMERGIRPVRSDGLFILEDEQNVERRSKGGIILPPRQQTGKARKATVISVGKDVRDPVVGARVLFDKAYGNRIPHDDDTVCRLLYLTTNQVEGVLEDESKVG